MTDTRKEKVNSLMKEAATAIKRTVENMNARIDELEDGRGGAVLTEPETIVNIDRKSREVEGMR